MHSSADGLGRYNLFIGRHFGFRAKPMVNGESSQATSFEVIK